MGCHWLKLLSKVIQKPRLALFSNGQKIFEGDSISQLKLDQTRQNILDTELFKEVTLRVEMRQSKLTLIIQQKEKYYTLLLPRLSRNGDGDIKLGVNLKLSNINGVNQKLNLLAENPN